MAESDYAKTQDEWLEKNAKGHVWEKIRGLNDFCAWDEGFHNGPRCSKCGYEPCMHCVQSGRHEMRRCEATNLREGK